MKYDQKTIEHFIREEGYRLTKYLDTTNHWTIGIGHKLTQSELKSGLSSITKEQAYNLLEKDLDVAMDGVNKLFPDYKSYPENTRLALLDMCFNLGYTGLSGFVITIDLIKQRRFKDAAQQALKSKWAQQVPNRAKRVTKLLEG